MFLSTVLKKAAADIGGSKKVRVYLQSVVSGHRRIGLKEKGVEKTERILYDPLIQEVSVYKETKRVKGK